jgi:hypothetical protein
MIEIDMKVIVIIIVVILIVWCVFPLFEGYDATGTEFVPVGCSRYGMRGDKLRRASILKYFIRPDRHVRLSQTNNVMWESNNPPATEGIPDCEEVNCPENTNEYGPDDTCWMCGSDKHYYPKIPYMHPHVPN